MTRIMIWRLWVGVAVIVAIVLYAGAAYGTTINVPIGIVRGAPGEVFPMGTVPAQPGDQCVAVLEARNNQSIHPDSDILVGPIIFPDVEDGAFQKSGLTFTATGPIHVAVRLGADGVFSAGFHLEVTCNPPETTTTTSTTVPPSTTSTTEPTSPSTSTTSPPVSTTTLSPPPSGPVEAGGGSEAGGNVGGVAVILGVALLVLGAIALVGGWWIGRNR